MYLSHLTFTGADDATDIAELAALSRQAPLIEWGLRLAAGREGQPRFASADWRARFGRAAPEARRSAHLVGQGMLEQLQAAARPGGSPLGAELRGVERGCPRYGRVQLDFLADRMPLTVVAGVVADWRHGRWTRSDASQIGLVTQHNVCNWSLHALFTATGRPNLYPDWYGVVFDEAGDDDWLPARRPDLLPGLQGGYAGGLNAGNVAGQLQELAAQLPDDASVWIELGEGVRTNGRFDLREVSAVLEAVQSVTGDVSLAPGLHVPATVTA